MDAEPIAPLDVLASTADALAGVRRTPAAQVRWHLRRLRAMSPAEVGARLTRDVRHRADDLEWRIARRRWRKHWTSPALRPNAAERPLGFMTAERAHVLSEIDPAGAATVVGRADAILAGDTSAVGYVVTSPQLRGHDLSTDPVSGYLWPSVHGKRVDYRDSPANPKAVWELNRCQELPVLVAASLISGDRRYEEAAASTLFRWLEHQVPGRGIAWASGFEAGIRAISLALTYDALAARPDLRDRLREPVLRSLWEHAHWIERDPSTHSSANNHRVGELVGLLSVGRLAPELPEADRWTRAALAALRTEAAAQVLPDGTGAEQAFAYTLFVLDLLLVAVALLDATDCDTPDEILDALDRAGHALWAQFGRPGEREPSYGDNDNGRAFRLDGHVDRLGRGVAASICARTGNRYVRTVAEELDPAAIWMFGIEGKDRFDRTTPAERPRSVILENAGLAVLRRAGTRVTFDAGPLGYLSIAAHGHADALAVTLSVDDDDLVVDPGSGTYFGRARSIRDAFRGTGFHATVLLDGTDQSRMGGPFLWSTHARSWFHRVDLPDALAIAEHDGYQREPTGVQHVRAVQVLGTGDVLVYDRVEGHGERAVSIRWPLNSCLRAEVVGANEVHARARDATGLLLKTAATRSGSMSVARGEREPLEGWSSPRLDQLVPAALIKWDAKLEGRLEAATLLRPLRTGVEASGVELRLDVVGSVVRIEIASAGYEHRVRLDVP